MRDLILRRCRLHGREDLVDIIIHAGRIEGIEHRCSIAGVKEIDCDGHFVSPPFVESHIHLDSVLTAGQPRFNESGTLFEGIQIWAQRKLHVDFADVQKRALEALRMMASHGVLYVRTHADVTESSLVALDALLDLREQVKDWLTLQVVAFPQDGIYKHPDNVRLLEEAIRRGVDAIGGIPHYELTREDGVSSVLRIFDLAERYDRLIDIHCDEIDDEQSRFLEVIVAEAYRRQNGVRVAASHTTSFGSTNDAYAYKLLGFLERAQINMIANPQINITLQGRLDTYPKRRGLTRIKEFWQRGINVSLGQDCIFDPWYVLGTGNLLSVAYMALHLAQMTGRNEIDACFEMVTSHGARTLAIPDYGIHVGHPANLVVIDATSAFEAIRKQSVARYVFSKGRLIAKTTPASGSFAHSGIPL